MPGPKPHLFFFAANFCGKGDSMAIHMSWSGRRRLSSEFPVGTTTPQCWLPVKDIHDDCLFRADEGVVGMSLAPFSFDLKVDQERAHIIHAFQAALNELTFPWELVSLHEPVDLNEYLAVLDCRQGATCAPRGPSTKIWAPTIVTSGIVRPWYAGKFGGSKPWAIGCRSNRLHPKPVNRNYFSEEDQHEESVGQFEPG